MDCMDYTDPHAEAVCKLFGAAVYYDGVMLSGDQLNSLMRLYGFHHEHAELLEEGMVRNLKRTAYHDGLRLSAVRTRRRTNYF